MSNEAPPFLPVTAGFEKRHGWTKLAEFDETITELKVRNGKLTAKVGGIWHIVPSIVR